MSRLPIPGGDDDTWGNILNDYLGVSHNADGTLKNNAVTTGNVTDSSITEAKLAGAVQTKLNASSSDATASTKGVIQLTGDLGGTAASPTVPGLAGKANTSHTHTKSQITDFSHTHTLANITDVTATAAELNKLDGVTATTAQLNYLVGVTSAIQAQLDALMPVYGTGSNGSYTKFPDGTMICTYTTAINPVANTNTGKTWTFPAAFIAAPTISVTCDTTAETVDFVAFTNATTTSVSLRIVRSNTTNTDLYAIAVGRWK